MQKLRDLGGATYSLGFKRAFTLAEGATHVGICDNIGKSAFTLAEVLITLAIIGMVGEKKILQKIMLHMF